MDFLTLAKKRYSCREFTGERVRKEDLDKILKAGHVAPTGCNHQPQRILVFNNEKSIEKVKKVSRSHFNCPTAMLVCYKKDECWVRKYDGKNCGVSDACSVIVHMLLQATEIGVGTTWVMHFNPEKARAEFNIPDDVKPVGFIMMGYPAPGNKPNALHDKFRDMSEVVLYDSF